MKNNERSTTRIHPQMAIPKHMGRNQTTIQKMGHTSTLHQTPTSHHLRTSTTRNTTLMEHRRKTRRNQNQRRQLQNNNVRHQNIHTQNMENTKMLEIEYLKPVWFWYFEATILSLLTIFIIGLCYALWRDAQK